MTSPIEIPDESEIEEMHLDIFSDQASLVSPPEYDIHSSQTLLPSYSLGSSTASRRSTEDTLNDTDSELLVIINKPYSIETFTQGSIISGDVIFRPKCDVTIAEVVIQLANFEDVLAKNHYNGNRVRRKIVLQTSAIPSYSILHGGKCSSEFTYYFPFVFQFKDIMPDNRTTYNLHDLPPPSFGYPFAQKNTKKAPQDIVADASVRISYGVTSTLFKIKHGKPEFEATAFFDFVPKNVLNRILEYSHDIPLFQKTGVYSASGPLLSNSKSISLMKNTEIGKLTLKLHNPVTCFKLISITDHFYETKLMPVSCSLNLAAHFTPKDPMSAPRKLMKLVSRLVSHTISSSVFLKGIPKPGENETQQTCTEVLSTQQLETLSPTWSKGGQNRFDTILRVPVLFEPDRRFLPTYFASLSSRQYHIVIELTFQKSRPFSISYPVIFYY